MDAIKNAIKLAEMIVQYRDLGFDIRFEVDPTYRRGMMFTVTDGQIFVRDRVVDSDRWDYLFSMINGAVNYICDMHNKEKK